MQNIIISVDSCSTFNCTVAVVGIGLKFCLGDKIQMDVQVKEKKLVSDRVECTLLIFRMKKWKITWPHLL